MEVIKAFKGFNQDMTCTPTEDIKFQYEEGKEYEENGAVACEKGFHACEYPLDVLGYYYPNGSVYHEVELSGNIDRSEDDKTCASKIKIGAEISIAGLVKAAIEYTRERTKKEGNSNDDYGASSATGYYGASSATGYYGASSATGYKGASSATGDCGASSATGYKGASSATGYYGASSATGNCGASSATGNCGASSATGYKGASSATGDYGASSATGDKGASSATGYKGASSATGDYGASSATGNCGASSATGYKGKSTAGDPESVAVAWGYKSMAKGVLGAFLVFADWEGNVNHYWNQEEWSLKGAKMVRVDGETIKADTWYTMENGEVIEAEE